MDYFTCTQSNAVPTLDFIWGGLNLFGGLAAAAEPDQYEDAGSIMAVGFGWAALSGMAGYRGTQQVSECRRAVHLHATRGAARSSEPAQAPVPRPVRGVVVDPMEASLAPGESLQLTASAFSAGGMLVEDAEYRWSSANPEVATVSDFGRVMAVARGETLIRVEVGGAHSAASIVVE